MQYHYRSLVWCLDLIEFVIDGDPLCIHIPDKSIVESVLIQENCQLPNYGLRTNTKAEGGHALHF